MPAAMRSWNGGACRTRARLSPRRPGEQISSLGRRAGAVDQKTSKHESWTSAGNNAPCDTDPRFYRLVKTRVCSCSLGQTVYSHMAFREPSGAHLGEHENFPIGQTKSWPPAHVRIWFSSCYCKELWRHDLVKWHLRFHEWPASVEVSACLRQLRDCPVVAAAYFH